MIHEATAKQLLHAAGYDPARRPPSETMLRSVAEMIDRAQLDPLASIADALRERRLAEEARANCAQAATAAGNLEQVLKDLLETPPALCHLEKIDRHPGGPARALCRMGGQLRELAIHPDVDLDALERLLPWEYVCVHPTEMVVIGSCTDADFFSGSQGSVVEFKGYRDRDQGLICVARAGHDEQVVRLAPTLREEPLSPKSRLVLQRDDERFAIAVLPCGRPESKFEVPIDQIRTRLEDLAGLDSIIVPLLEDLLIRHVRPEIRDQFDLKPLRGMILSSFKPGMGKTALMRAIALWLHELGQEHGFDVVLYLVKPNELKNMFHGEDARLVREDLCGAIRARQMQPRTRPLFQLVVLDEIDSLGRRGSHSHQLSAAGDDAIQALLVEMDGMIQAEQADPPASVLWVGLTNKPDDLDIALKRPGRFGDCILPMPDLDQHAAESVMAIYARRPDVPWYLDGQLRTGVELDELRTALLRPALARVFPAVVLRYFSDTQRAFDVSAGQILSGAHYENAVNGAKRRAAVRRLWKLGVPGIGYEDLVESLFQEARSAAAAMAGDWPMLVRQLQVKVPLARVEVVPEEELAAHRYLRVRSA
jgi:SpoVK/Ycf46/Vps4 family AAA+-type ATPase